MIPPDSSPSPYYPVFLYLRNQRCLVVGGGAVARRKVEGLVAAQANVVVVAPHINPMPDGVTCIRREVAPADLEGAVLVIAATHEAVINARIASEARRRGIPVNVVDDPDHCSFIVPAVARRGELQIAVSTSGASPTLARRIKESLEEAYGDEYGVLINLLHRLRSAWEPRAKAAELPAAIRRQAWEQVLDLPLLDLIRDGQLETAVTMARAALDALLPVPADEHRDGTPGIESPSHIPKHVA